MSQNNNIPLSIPIPNQNILSQLTSRPVFYSILGLIIFLTIMLFLVLYDVKFTLSKSKEETVRDTFIILFSTLLFFGFCIMFFPYLKDFKQFILQIYNVIFVVLYTVFVILFYVLTPEPVLKKYSYIINPAILGLGALSFYMSSYTNFISGFNMSYERIKMVIVFLCLIATLSTFHNANPGSMYSIILIVASIFAFLYTAILLTMPSSGANTNSSFTSFGLYGSILFLIFLAATTGIIYSQKNTLFENKGKSATIIMFLLIICILWTTLLGAHLFSQSNSLNMNDFYNIGFLKTGLIAVFGLVVSGLLIYWISSKIEELTGSSSIISFALNLALVAVVLALIYKTINVQLPYANAKKNAFFGLITSVILYIPCIISSLFDNVSKLSSSELNYQNRSSFLMLIVSIILLICYYYSNIFLDRINTIGGKQLVNKPVNLNKQYNLGNYINLNGNDKMNYQYAISCWIFIDSAPPNTNSNYKKFTPILNYGNKPAVLYNAEKNTLRIIMQQQDLKTITKNKLIDYDNEDNRIIYENKNFPLQKWHNIIINYNGGTLDIFLNGQLVKSSIEVSPLLTYDNLVIGQDQGILGGICNVLYFKQSIDSSKVFYLYNTVKNLTPPVFNDYKETIMV